MDASICTGRTLSIGLGVMTLLLLLLLLFGRSSEPVEGPPRGGRAFSVASGRTTRSRRARCSDSDDDDAVGARPRRNDIEHYQPASQYVSLLKGVASELQAAPSPRPPTQRVLKVV